MPIEKPQITSPQPCALSISGPADIDPPDEVVEKVVFRLNGIAKAATFDFAIAVGALIINNLYGGDLDGWRHRGPKCSSFRRLAKHPELSMSAGALYRSVAIYELCERFGVKKCRHVSTSHLRLMLPLGRQDQERLLNDAETGRWSVRRLQKEIAMIGDRHERAQPGRGGRRHKSKLRGTVRALDNCIEACDELVRTGTDDVSPESARAIVHSARKMRALCFIIENRIRHQFPGARTDPPPPNDASSVETATASGQDHS
jgi:hypothetical protein